MAATLATWKNKSPSTFTDIPQVRTELMALLTLVNQAWKQMLNPRRRCSARPCSCNKSEGPVKPALLFAFGEQSTKDY